VAPADHPGHAQILNNLVCSLGSRFERTGVSEDLQEAIRRVEKAVVVTPADHPDRAWMLSSLACCLTSRFKRTGGLEDLQEAIRRGEEVVVQHQRITPIVLGG
jgi:hypothetical protein